MCEGKFVRLDVGRLCQLTRTVELIAVRPASRAVCGDCHPLRRIRAEHPLLGHAAAKTLHDVPERNDLGVCRMVK